MSDEVELNELMSSEPSMNRHYPASETSQDISHLLVNVFKELYSGAVIGKDTVSNLSKSARGGNLKHETYVQELQEVNAEYDRRIQNTNLLETHIVQARLQASKKEEHSMIQIAEEVGRNPHRLGLNLVKPAFRWCVDGDLLKNNNLICLSDYAIENTPAVNRPRAKFNTRYAEPTLSFQMLTCNDPQEDGYAPPTPPAFTAPKLLERPDDTMTFFSSEQSGYSESPFIQHKATRVEKPSSKILEEEQAALQKFKDRKKFLRNPRFMLPNSQRGGKSLIMPQNRLENVEHDQNASEDESPDDDVPIFAANPAVILFAEYEVGEVSEVPLELINMTATSRHVRLIPPTSPHFSVSLGRFPGEGGIVAPGMSCHYMVRFVPDSLGDHEDVLVVETQMPNPLIIPVKAHRPPAKLSFPAFIDCGYCLVGGVQIMEISCCNEGPSSGTFCMVPKDLWPDCMLSPDMKETAAEHPPFSISPSSFRLNPREKISIKVVFSPTAAGVSSQVFVLICDSRVTEISVQGSGQLVTVDLVSVSGGEDQPDFGGLSDVAAGHFVSMCTNPHATLEKTLIIKNTLQMELSFIWEIMRPNFQPQMPRMDPDPSSVHQVDTESAFDIRPATGVLTPAEEHEFTLRYCPTDLKDYHSVSHLIIRDVPQVPTDGQMRSLQLNDVTALEIDLKGSTEPYKVLFEPYAILIQNEIYIDNIVRKKFTMLNHSKSTTYFQWEHHFDGCKIEVEPSTGEIEMGKCLDLELVLKGTTPGNFTIKLTCHVQNQDKPLTLDVDVMFKGPHCFINLPALDFGLLEVGTDSVRTIQITNNSLVKACWSLEELPPIQSPAERQVNIKPSEGVLKPLASCEVDVIFTCLHSQRFESVLQLIVLKGSGCHLSVRADVQTPQVCLQSSELKFPDLYVGVPQQGTTTLINQTLLPTPFAWSKLRGAHAHLCSATFSPSSGVLEPGTETTVFVLFTAHTVEELTELAAVCEVKGMKTPLVLGFNSKPKPVSVTYSLIQSDCVNASEPGQQPIRLDFTENGPVLIGQAIMRQLLITNTSAITTPFSVEAEYFTGSFTKPSESLMFLHSVQAKKVQQKSNDDFVNSLLSNGRGAVFFSEPHSGILHPFESQTINITAFTNMWGDYQDNLVCKVGDLDPTLIPMQMCVRGCPVYFQTTGPQPDNQNQGPDLRFGSHVSGGDTVSRCLRLNNISPYDIRMDWMTFNVEDGDSKLIDLLVYYGDPFPVKDTEGNELIGGLDSRVLNPTTTSREGTNSTFITKSTNTDESKVEKIGEPHKPKKKLFSVFLNAHEGKVSNSPYCISPQQTVIPAGGSSIINVCFTPLILSSSTSQECLAYALGFMTLDSTAASLTPGKVERVQGHDLEPLRLDMTALVKSAFLSVQMEEETGRLEFSAAVSDALDEATQQKITSKVTRTLQLKNDTDMTLSFRLETQPPFSVLQPQRRLKQPTRSTKHTHTLSITRDEPTLLLLQPKHLMQVKVAFDNSSSLLTCLNEASVESQLSTSLLCNDAGERTLELQQNLRIIYKNDSVQTVPLHAHLSLPTLQLPTASVNFGTCYIGQTAVREIFLYNRGLASSYWTALAAEGENGVFLVAPDSGVLRSKSKQLLQISFTASDQKEFQTNVTVKGILGETTLIFNIYGQGSFDEKFVKRF